MNARRKNRSLRPKFMAVCMLAAGLTPFAAMAQSWEAHSGLNPHRDFLRGVTEVQYCSGGGQASVGTQRVPPGTAGLDNILVQRLGALNPIAPVIWRNSYDSGDSEQGGGIVEFTDASGFAIVGNRTNPATGQSHLTVSKIDCAGNMVWQYGYGLTTGTNIAWDIIRANTGTPALSTNPGDLIALGEYSINGTTMVRVVRLESDGDLIWSVDYSVPGGLSLHGRGIAEVDTPSITDDLVVAGGAGNNAAIFQINGDDGSFICGSRLPGLGISRFNDITRHGGITGIAAGFTPVGETRTAANALPQAFIASYRSVGCALQGQVHWGSITESETAQAVTTVRATTFNTVPAGQLLIAGNLNGPFSSNPNSVDVWTHLMVPISLTAYTAGGYTGQRFGAQYAGLSGAETVADVAEGTNGAYFVGATTSNWNAANIPEDGYSARLHRVFARTQCSVPWKAPILPLAEKAVLSVNGLETYLREEFLKLPRKPIEVRLCCVVAAP